MTILLGLYLGYDVSTIKLLLGDEVEKVALPVRNRVRTFRFGKIRKVTKWMSI